MFSIRLHLFVMCHKFVINMYRVIALLFVFLHGTLIEKHKNVLIFFSYMWISPHGSDCKRAVRQNKRTGSLEKVQNCTMRLPWRGYHSHLNPFIHPFSVAYLGPSHRSSSLAKARPPSLFSHLLHLHWSEHQDFCKSAERFNLSTCPGASSK